MPDRVKVACCNIFPLMGCLLFTAESSRRCFLTAVPTKNLFSGGFHILFQSGNIMCNCYMICFSTIA